MCNCQNRNSSCGCPNANCSCPPDYSFSPTTLTCQGTNCETTLPTSCIYTSAYLSCSQQNIGTDLQTVLTAMDAKICQCGSCSGNTFQPLSLFYIDSNNTEDGDGSVGNPYKTIEFGYAAVIGTGTTDSPQYTGASIYVMGGNYTTSQNIYIPSTRWTFLDGANVTFTGSGNYLIDTSGSANGVDDFYVFGSINFKTSNGGFLQNSGAYISASKNKAVYVEAFKIIGSTTGTTLPLINHIVSGGSGFARPSTTINMTGIGSLIASAQQHCIFYNGSYCGINLNGGSIFYGVDFINGTTTGSSQGNIVKHALTDSLNPGSSFFFLKNGNIASVHNSDMVLVSNKYCILILENLYNVTLGVTLPAPKTFLNLTTNDSNVVTESPGGDSIPYNFLLKEIYLNSFGFSSNNVLDFNGTGNSFSYLDMQNCVLYSGCTVPTTILVGQNTQGGTVASFNIINGVPKIYKIPTSTAGLTLGAIWSSGGTLHIV